jgi:hypothetical protein
VDDLLISRAEVETAQRSWARALVEVGAANNWEESHRLATGMVRDHYLLDGTLLFCPTRAADRQFRSGLEDSVSYFVGRNPEFPEDHGFALDRWARVRFENHGIVCRDGLAVAMGNYFFTRGDRDPAKVEFSLLYVRDADRSLKIQLHHSAMPFGS